MLGPEVLDASRYPDMSRANLELSASVGVDRMNGHLVENSRETFDELVLPHLDSAYNLARWLVRNNHDAEDVVQDAFLRAFRYFGSFHGGDPRAWLLKIVRNVYYRWL